MIAGCSSAVGSISAGCGWLAAHRTNTTSVTAPASYSTTMSHRLSREGRGMPRLSTIARNQMRHVGVVQGGTRSAPMLPLPSAHVCGPPDRPHREPRHRSREVVTARELRGVLARVELEDRRDLGDAGQLGNAFRRHVVYTINVDDVNGRAAPKRPRPGAEGVSFDATRSLAAAPAGSAPSAERRVA